MNQQDQLYRRSLGKRFDNDTLQREIENGVGSAEPLEDYSFELNPSDLYFPGVDTSSAQERIRAIAELSHLEQPTLKDKLDLVELQIDDVKHQELMSADDVIEIEIELARLDAKKLALLEKQFYIASEEHPVFVEALKDWLTTELMSRSEAGDPVDDEMFVEAEIMADLIGELNEDKDTSKLKEIAAMMREIFKTEHELIELTGVSALSHSPSDNVLAV